MLYMQIKDTNIVYFLHLRRDFLLFNYSIFKETYIDFHIYSIYNLSIYRNPLNLVKLFHTLHAL